MMMSSMCIISTIHSNFKLLIEIMEFWNYWLVFGRDLAVSVLKIQRSTCIAGTGTVGARLASPSGGRPTRPT